MAEPLKNCPYKDLCGTNGNFDPDQCYQLRTVTTQGAYGCPGNPVTGRLSSRDWNRFLNDTLVYCGPCAKKLSDAIHHLRDR